MKKTGTLEVRLAGVHLRYHVEDPAVWLSLYRQRRQLGEQRVEAKVRTARFVENFAYGVTVDGVWQGRPAA